MTPLFRKFLGMNWVLVLTMYGLLVFGIFAIYGASWTREGEYLLNSWNRQVYWIAIGTFLFFTVSLVDYRWIVWGALPMYFISLGFLVTLRFVGVTSSGATSWLDIGFMNFQPSQFAIVSGILLLALVLSKLQHVHVLFRHPGLRLVICGLIMVIPFFLVLKEPDIGSAAVWLPVLGGLLLVGSIPFRYLTVLVLSGLMVIPVVYFFVLKNYQKERVDTYLNMLTGKQYDEKGAGWVPKHCMIAIGSAGWEGKGYKTEKSVANLWLPEKVAINDFIFASVAEEHGFRGAMILISAQALLLFQCIFVAFYSRDQLGRLIVVGVGMLVFTHVFMNVGMNVLLVPVAGLPLPFVSYGGTFILTLMFLLGLVQSVWVHRDRDTSAAERIPRPTF